ncbi:hypothetical protein NDU88_006422 [Pleurodeles waltl]|uniref:Uncharacterized protein n=1 Tax=Pleurodeles waltl TaxID=8319 RepID=A0AAV7WDX6_PLEWA|nr:hypothetical protein NDU88_006422 [Pleurodeles waltl]
MESGLSLPCKVRGVLVAFGTIKKPQALRAAPSKRQEASTNTKQGSSRPRNARAAPSRAWCPVLQAAQSDARLRDVHPAAHRPRNAAPQQRQSVARARDMRVRRGRAAKNLQGVLTKSCGSQQDEATKTGKEILQEPDWKLEPHCCRKLSTAPEASSAKLIGEKKNASNFRVPSE